MKIILLVTLTLALNKAKARNTRPRPKASQGQGQKSQGQDQGQGQRSRLRSNSIVMACNCSLVQKSINPQQISKQFRTLPSFYYHIKYSWCKLKRNVSQMPILILLSFKILAARRIIENNSIGHFDLCFEQGQG